MNYRAVSGLVKSAGVLIQTGLVSNLDGKALPIVKGFFLAVCAVAVSGCSSLGYFYQAAVGHLEVLAKSEPIEEVLADGSISGTLHTQLEYARQIRDFSVEQLGLPDNRSYRLYADLERQYVVWNVVAAPADSLTLNRWCFPLVGCISYKGFYNEEAALALAEELRAGGLDVAVTGVPAYSTLGYTSDPVLNTFVNYPAPELARMIFHELAHQVVYIEDDTLFNESFATAVEELGVLAWMASRSDSEMARKYEVFDERRRRFKDLIAGTRQKLEIAYNKPVASRETKLEEKKRIFEELVVEYEFIKRSEWAGWSGYDRYFTTDLNNAKLALAGLYNQRVSAFKVLFARCDADFDRFYKAVAALGKLKPAVREVVFEGLENRQALSFGLGCDQSMFIPQD